MLRQWQQHIVTCCCDNDHKQQQLLQQQYPQHPLPPLPQQQLPCWIPQPGEELCQLTGSWCILQCVASHCGMTHDLVTAWCAAQECQQLL